MNGSDVVNRHFQSDEMFNEVDTRNRDSTPQGILVDDEGRASKL